MARKIKTVIIGAGSTYTPELIEGLINRRGELGPMELVLMDIDRERLGILGGMARRMFRAAGAEIRVELCDDYSCVAGADYVITQIRVGKMQARINDEKIPLKYGMIGQETCGIGGFFKAMRTIPVISQIAGLMEKLCPDAVMINFTNPSGLIAQSLEGRAIRSVGLCNCPYAMEKSVKDQMGLEDAEVEYVGLNHLSWLTAIRKNGKDYLAEAIEGGVNGAAMKNIPANGFSIQALRAAGGIPSTYLEYYYFKNEKLKKLLSEQKCRGEVCRELEGRLLEMYKDENLCVKPKELEMRGGAYYSMVAVSLIDAIENDRGTRHVVNVPNGGALPFMDDDDVVECAATVWKNKIEPIPIGKFENYHIIGLMRQMKAYERLAVKAAFSRKKEDAMAALLINPLCGDFASVSACYDEMREANAPYLEGV